MKDFNSSAQFSLVVINNLLFAFGDCETKSLRSRKWSDK